MRMNKGAGGTDIFLFIILALVILFICGVFIFIGGKAQTELKSKLGTMDFGGKNGSDIVDESIGKVNEAYQSLYWISWVLMIGMVFGIFIGSYLVTTRPIFIIPYFFIGIIAVIVSVVISNTYGNILEDPTLGPTFQGFLGANYIMGYLPIWVTIITFVGAIILFSRMGRDQYSNVGGYYG